jgi:hypothetical protein
VRFSCAASVAFIGIAALLCCFDLFDFKTSKIEENEKQTLVKVCFITALRFCTNLKFENIDFYPRKY